MRSHTEMIKEYASTTGGRIESVPVGLRRYFTGEDCDVCLYPPLTLRTFTAHSFIPVRLQVSPNLTVALRPPIIHLSFLS